MILKKIGNNSVILVAGEVKGIDVEETSAPFFTSQLKLFGTILNKKG